MQIDRDRVRAIAGLPDLTAPSAIDISQLTEQQLKVREAAGLSYFVQQPRQMLTEDQQRQRKLAGLNEALANIQRLGSSSYRVTTNSGRVVDVTDFRQALALFQQDGAEYGVSAVDSRDMTASTTFAGPVNSGSPAPSDAPVRQSVQGTDGVKADIPAPKVSAMRAEQERHLENALHEYALARDLELAPLNEQQEDVQLLTESVATCESAFGPFNSAGFVVAGKYAGKSMASLVGV